ncbi:SagB family peptide dehydrogenase [Nocardiopsis sp. MG754419]|uniref:SagB family peptide dehydrogenase n=1 Tax=Nocardiopsis sp. MG754419 TaxID=2259865 RepID=UPI001BAD329D|nr:SagB family peptide dehydrogenase [Nocardiopsis sp. MG754419]MBR8740365.1 SagB/ThcOx family dehydrogenase [Nocardiopsis sp. MG754419]
MSTADHTIETDAGRETVSAYLADRELPQVSGAYQLYPTRAGRPGIAEHPLPRPSRHPDGPVDRISRMLATGNGLARHRFLTVSGARAFLPTGAPGWGFDEQHVMTTLLRLVASGGAAYPVDLWLLSAGTPGLPTGAHRYNPVHHALTQITDEDPRPRLARALGGPVSDLTIVLTTRLERTTGRYGKFAHRLHLLDTGHTLTQLLVAGKTLDWECTPRLSFVDDEIEHLMELGDETEIAFAVLSVGPTHDVTPASDPAPSRVPTVPDRYPQEVLGAVRRSEPGEELNFGEITLPGDPVRAMLRRRSPVGGFVAPAPTMEALEPVAAAVDAVLAPLGGHCMLVPPKDPRVATKIGAPGHRLNLSLAGVLVPVLDLPALVEKHGPGAFRAGAVAIGASLQAGALIAADRGLGTFPLCAYDGPGIEQSLGLPEASTMCVAPIGVAAHVGAGLEVPL